MRSTWLSCGLTLAAIVATDSRVVAETGSAGSPRSASPNIVFILADDQGWNGTSVQMHPEIAGSKSDFHRTPNLEKLADQGLRFSHAYAPAPMCTPTRASLQTGKSPAHLRMTNVGGGRRSSTVRRLILPPHSSRLAEDETTIGETLQNAGYATAWFGKWHLGGDGPSRHGYDESDGATGNGNGNTSDQNNPKDIFGITRRGIAFMEKNAKAKKPFYLQLWHYAVHGPVQSKPATTQAYADRAAGQRHRAPAFAGMTEDLDTGVGMILDKIDELSIADNTYVIYMSDHGAGSNLASNAPLNRGKGTLWEGGVRVPLIIRGPGIQAGGHCDEAVVGWDLFPTFCELAGIDRDLPKGLDGVSLKPFFQTGEASIDRGSKPIALHFPHYAQTGPHSTITEGDFKLIKFYETDELQLFDLNKDIWEQQDLSEARPELTANMHQRLQDYLASVDAALPTKNPDFDPNALAADPRRPSGRGGPNARNGERRGPGGRGPNARGGRIGRGRASIAERHNQVTAFQDALEKNDMKKVGQLITEIKESLENSPAGARPRPGGAGSSRRQQLESDVRELEAAHQNSDREKLGQLIEKVKQRLDSAPSRPSPGAQRPNSAGRPNSPAGRPNSPAGPEASPSPE